jgi:hypothetical protein
MASQKSYAPKAGDTVLVKDHSGRFVITQVDTTAQTADVRATSGDIAGDIAFVKAVPWAFLSYLDASQNAARIVREATDDF